MTSVTVAPYDQAGNLMHWAEPKPDLYGEPIDWRPNEPFEAVLAVAPVRSSARYVIVTDEQDHTFSMFVTDLLDVLRSPAGIVNGRTGKQQWVIGRRGKNYGVKLAPLPRRQTQSRPAMSGNPPE